MEMSEEFSEISSQSIRALVKHLVEIGEVLNKELPFDYLTPSCHVENGTDNYTVGFFAKWGETLHSLMIYTHYLDAPPEPKEMYPPNCCAIGTLEISSSEPLPREAFEVCGTPEGWMVHHNDKWVPLSSSYVAFLMGINQKRPSDS